MTTARLPSVGHAVPAADACSVQWDADRTSAYGTAARARCFVVLEQAGPWGRDAARQSHLDPVVGAELDARTSGVGGRFMLIRSPGEHPDQTGPHRVFVAFAGDGATPAWLLAADVDDPATVLDLDWVALAAGDRERVAESLTGARPTRPQLLVCTNGRRDVCCAVRGRPLAAAGATVAPDQVWEVSHTGGHRFAPTAVLLPWGQTLARLEQSMVAPLLSAADSGRLPAELLGVLHDRGRSAHSSAAATAESHVRVTIAETALEALWPVSESPTSTGHEVTVRHSDGRRWQVAVTRRPTDRTRPESCGKAAIDVFAWDATILPPGGN